MTQGGLRAVGWSALCLMLLLSGCARSLVSPVAVSPSARSASGSGRSRFFVRLEVRSSEALVDYNFSGKELSDWGPRLSLALDESLGPESVAQTIIAQVTLHRDREASVELSASPVLSSALSQRLVRSLRESAPPKTKLVDFTLRVVAKVGAGSPDGESACLPKLLSPHEKRLAELQAATLGQRLQILQAWSVQEVLPVLTAAMQAAEPDFPGVRGVGTLLQRERKHGPVSQLLDGSMLYWRGLLEMSPGNPLLLSSRLFLYLARGELDLTRLYMKPIYYFAKSDNLAHDYLEQLRDYLIAFYDSLDARIRVGVALHDESRFDDAISLYDGILRDYPCSALALYERWFAKNEKELRPGSAQAGSSLDEWEQVRSDVFRCNPMFEIDAVSVNEQRRQQMMRRLALRALWKDRRSEGEDYLRYADIALDLGEYGLAAHLYFLIGTGLSARAYGDRNVLAHFLYSVEKLGVTELKTLFKGDHQRDFADIDKQRAARLRGDGKLAN